MIKEGELITLDGNKEYLCLSKCSLEGKNYLYLVGNFKPAEVLFVEEIVTNGEIDVIEVPYEMKEVLLKEFIKDANGEEE